jgi:hydrogenase maturation protease
MSTGRILIAGIGNIFFGDDAFGVEVAGRLGRRPLPEGVRVVDFGIRGLDLTFSLLDDYEAVILVDAVPRGGRPGTLYVLEPETAATGGADAPGPTVELHALDPQKVLRLSRALGGKVERVLLVGCEPGPPTPDDDLRMEMSAPVHHAVEEAVRLIKSLVAGIRADGPPRPGRPGGQPRDE